MAPHSVNYLWNEVDYLRAYKIIEKLSEIKQPSFKRFISLSNQKCYRLFSDMLHKKQLFFDSKTILDVLQELTGLEENQINLSFISCKPEN